MNNRKDIFPLEELQKDTFDVKEWINQVLERHLDISAKQGVEENSDLQKNLWSSLVSAETSFSFSPFLFFYGLNRQM